MAKKMLINTVHPEEARVAIVEDGRLVELDVEIAGSEQTRGNVYKGVVVRVEPGLQAAFVDIGLKKLGFLQMGELHPDFWQWHSDIPEENRKRRPRIQEVLRRGQELIVQVEKGERDMKGAALTTYLSFPGRYMVLMPGSDSAGVSRKVENEADRKALKEMAAGMKIPEGVGYIIRTEALGKKKTELNKDLQSLVKLHKDILAKAKKTKAPALIYQELDLVIRTIRDYFTAEIDEVLIDNPEVFQQAKDFFKATMPKHEGIVKLHHEKRPIFSKYQLEEQIDQIYEKKVLLKSGGSLVIEPTEALVSIDVNSGKSTGEKGVEDTAFKTNLEAAEEVARQLRLRDLGGLIVIDFIDMRDKKHMAEVEKTLKNALKLDKARVTVGRISQFGMLEMSRQRIKQTLEQGSVLECPHCSGRGKVKGVENMAISFLRKVHAAAAKGTTAEVRGGLPLEVAYFLLNRKKRELTQIENDYDIEVTIKGKPSFLMNQLEIELIKREKPHHVEAPEHATEALAAVPSPEQKAGSAATAPAPAVEEGKAKKKRRRGKKGKGEEEPAVVEAVEAETGGGEAEAEVPAAEGAEIPGQAETEELQEGGKKKRRRRRRRGKGQAGEAPEAPEAGEPLAEAPAAAGAEETRTPAAVPMEAAEHAEGGKKKRRRRRRRGKGQGGEAIATFPSAAADESVAAVPTIEAAAVPAQIVAEPAAAKKSPAKAPRQRKAAVAAANPVAAAVHAEDGGAPEAPVKPKRTRKPAVAAEAPLTEPAPTVAEAAPAAKKPQRKKKTVAAEGGTAGVAPAPEAPTAEVPAKKRAPRKKKTED
ncbi:MAG TPA: Rne/Rng family ribonuclease [Geobacteraceae bacterium]